MKELQKYCLVSRKKFYILSVILAPIAWGLFVAIMMMPDEDSDGMDAEPAAIISVIVVVVLWFVLHWFYIRRPRKRFNGRLKYFESQGVLQYAISDVQRGVKKFDDKVLLGEYCIMTKGMGLIVFYKEISAMYVKVDVQHDEDGTTESWTRKIDAAGKTYDLCNVRKGSDSIRDWADICTFLQIKAPHIVIK